jgi:SNF family Na+-dependent transporter
MDARYTVTPSPANEETPTVPEIVCLVQNGNNKQKKAPPQRQQWSRKLEFVLSSLGYAVGFGNIWRFPYLLYRYGGGTFLIPYLIFVLITGIPLMTLEMSVAQFAGLGPFNIYDEMCPAMKGLGVTTFLTSFVNSIQYVQLLAYVVYYFFASFSLDLPWTNCDNPWNPNGCIGPCNSRTPAGESCA